MKEHPILFSGPMVRAIIEGRKTQTRRVIKPQPVYEGKRSYGDSWSWKKGKDWFSGATTEQLIGEFGLLFDGRCPYGKPGDLLWVRETCWVCIDNNDRPRPVADGPAPTTEIRHYNMRPSIFMPRSESRLTLRITDVRVQRVQEIGHLDIIREGLTEWLTDEQQTDSAHKWEAKRAFGKLWDSINAKRGYSWESNPWVWALTFERVTL